MAGSIFIPLVSVFDAKGIREAQTSMKGLTVVLRSLKTTALTAAVSFATIGAGNFIREATAAARDLERNLVGLEGVFTSTTPEMNKFVKDAEALGLSQVDAARASTFLGSVLKQSGFSMQDTAQQTKNLVGLASDLAATYGYDVSEALTGMTALFRGEYDPIEKFGVAMKQAEVNALLAARGQKNLTGESLRLATAQARLDILYQRSTDAQGAFARQSDSLFVKQKQLAATFDNMKASVGAALTDPLAKLAGALQPIVEKVGPALTPVFNNFAKVLEFLSPLLLQLSEVAMALWEAFSPIIEVIINITKPIIAMLVPVLKLMTLSLKQSTGPLLLFSKIIEAVLVPILSFLAMILTTIVGLVYEFVSAMAEIPVIGDGFKGARDALSDFANSFQGTNDSILEVKDNSNDMLTILSRNYGGNAIDDIKASADNATTSLKKTTDALSGVIDKATETQRSLLGAFDITALMNKNEDTIVESVVYIDGKFKSVVSSVRKGSTNIVSSFSENLNKLKGFYANFNKLLAAGLDPELIQQIVSAGPEAGNATAEAILASGQEGISSLNKTFTDMRKISGDFGAKLAKKMQAIGSRIGNGLIDGLVAQKDSLIAQAAALGNEVGAALGDSVTRAVDESLKAGIQGLSGKNKSDVLAGSGRTGNIFSKITPNMDWKKMTGIQTVAASNISNPYNANESFLQYKKFEQARTQAAQYNIEIKVAPTANAAAVGEALVAAIQAYERSKGKVFSK